MKGTKGQEEEASAEDNGENEQDRVTGREVKQQQGAGEHGMNKRGRGMEVRRGNLGRIE